MVEKDATHFNSMLGELLRHSNGIAFAQRNVQVLRYLIWKWELSQGLNKTESNVIVQEAMDAVDHHLQSLLQESESESEFRLAIEKLLNIRQTG